MSTKQFFYISILYISCYSGGRFAYTILCCVYFLSRPTFKIRPKHRNTNFKVKKTEFKYQHAFKKKIMQKNKTKHTSFQIDNMIKHPLDTTVVFDLQLLQTKLKNSIKIKNESGHTWNIGHKTQLQ